MSETTDRDRETALAEQSVVGSILISPECLGDVLTRVRAEDFRSAQLRALFTAARDLYLAQKPADVVTITDRAGGGDLVRLGMECMEITPTAANVLTYCETVREQAALRRVRAAAYALLDAANTDDARDVLARANAALSDRPGWRSYTLTEIMADFLTRMAQPKPDYLPWGLGLLDTMLHTDAGSYVILAARPSTGKTALGLQLALNIAQEKRVGFYSYETKAARAGDRMAAATLDIGLPSIKERRLTASDMLAAANRMGENKLLQGRFELIEAGGMTVGDIRASALAKRLDVVMIDYIQLIRPSIRGERAAQMQQVSMDLLAMAQLTGVTVIALAQVKRRDGKSKEAATMEDLKESGQFEQDADTILLLYHENPEARSSDRWLKIEKNKDGYAGYRARLRFDGKKQRFTPVNSDGTPIKTKFEDIPEQYSMEDIPWN